MERVGNGQNGGNQQKNDYTFLNLKHSIGKDGKPYDSITMECKVKFCTDLKQTGPNKQVINFKAPFTLTENKQKKLMSFWGALPTTGDKGTVWVKIAMWDGLADRFNKKASKVKEMTIIITGAVKLVQSGEQGQYINMEVNADDFMVVSEVKDETAPVPNQQGAAPAYPQQAYQQAGYPQQPVYPQTAYPQQPVYQQPVYQQAPQQVAPQYQPQQVAQPVYQAPPAEQVVYQQPVQAPVEAPAPAPIPEPEPICRSKKSIMERDAYMRPFFILRR